ncbi:MAG: DUF4442 domain-containing protein [Pseudomonadota bacterium]
MGYYQTIGKIGSRFIAPAALMKYGFNLSPMYRRTTARVVHVSKDLTEIRVRLPISYRNRNYVGSIFGGSMFAAVDPFPMVQLINLLESKYIVWDKSAQIFFKRPAYEDLYAVFEYSHDEVNSIRSRVDERSEMEIVRVTPLTDKSGSTVFAEIHKTLYVATKAHYNAKQEARKKRVRAAAEAKG